MPGTGSLIAKCRDGDSINTKRIPMDSGGEEAQGLIESTHCDIIYVDLQHGPDTEWGIVCIPSLAEECDAPAQLRIKHARYGICV